MSLLSWSIILAFVAAAVYLSGWGTEPELPEIGDGWWGRGKKTKDLTKVTEFKINISESVLADLKLRLVNTRLGEDLENNENFHYGFNVATMRQVIAHWKDKYDWRAHEKELNSFPQYKTQIEGIDVHFLRVKPKVKGKGRPRALIMTHGWPGSVWEFYKIIPLLTDPGKHGGRDSDAVEVICPSIPGYGFSEAPHQPGFDQTDAARVFSKLMERLGHRKYYVQGGDWGGLISQFMSIMYPSKVIGAHLNMYTPPASTFSHLKLVVAMMLPSVFYKENEQKVVGSAGGTFMKLLRESGYMHIQATKPDTIGMALNESPVGLAGYILEKFSTWTRNEFTELPDGGLTKYYTMDELLTNVMIYWVTGTITSSQRFYKEYFTEVPQLWDRHTIKVPAGLAFFPDELIPTAEFQARLRFKDIVQLTDMPQGGHFAALEQPTLLANDIQNFIRKVELRLKEQGDDDSDSDSDSD